MENRNTNLDFAELPLETRIDALVLMTDYDWVNVEYWETEKGNYWDVYIGTYITGDNKKPAKKYSFYKGDFDKKAIDMACLLKFGTVNL